MSYLMIENRVQHIPSIELLITLGLSASRGIEENAGQFGTGHLHGLAILARKGLLEGTKLCMGTDVYTHFVKHNAYTNSRGEIVNDSRIWMKKQNGRSYDLNISTGFGEINWRSETLAIREFISNAIDGAMSYNGTIDSVVIDDAIPDEGRSTRAKAGTIRLYVPINDTIKEYINNKEKFFLHFTTLYDPKQQVITKYSDSPARLYRKGIFVGEFGEHSLFNYNINDIEIDESRNVAEYAATSAASRAIGMSGDTGIISKFLRSKLTGDDEIWENNLSSYHLNPDNNWSVNRETREAAVTTWNKATQAIVGNKVICENNTLGRMVEGKGLCPQVVDSDLFKLLSKYGAKTSEQVLNSHELQGLELAPANDNVLRMLDKVWDFVNQMEMTVGKAKPSVMLYHQNTIIEGASEGYYRPGGDTVYVRSDMKDDMGLVLAHTLLHELAHHITGAADCTREFEEFSGKLAAKAMLLIM